VPRVGKVDADCNGQPVRFAGPAPTGNSCQCEGTAAPDGEDAGCDIERPHLQALQLKVPAPPARGCCRCGLSVCWTGKKNNGKKRN